MHLACVGVHCPLIPLCPQQTMGNNGMRYLFSSPSPTVMQYNLTDHILEENTVSSGIRHRWLVLLSFPFMHCRLTHTSTAVLVIAIAYRNQPIHIYIIHIYFKVSSPIHTLHTAITHVLKVWNCGILMAIVCETQQFQCYNHVSDYSVKCANGTSYPETHTRTHT